MSFQFLWAILFNTYIQKTAVIYSYEHSDVKNVTCCSKLVLIIRTQLLKYTYELVIQISFPIKKIYTFICLSVRVFQYPCVW